MAEHPAVNRVVVGSSPTWGAQVSRESDWLFVYGRIAMKRHVMEPAQNAELVIGGLAQELRIFTVCGALLSFDHEVVIALAHLGDGWSIHEGHAAFH